MEYSISFEPLPGLAISLAATDRGLCRLSLEQGQPKYVSAPPEHALLVRAARQVEEYFRGERRDFDVPLDLPGTAFQQHVWQELLRIPYGETRSYAQVARAIGSPKAVRAVGRANGANPVAIIVPCHRVIAADGGLCGYGGGLEWKKRLLELEARVSAYPGEQMELAVR